MKFYYAHHCALWTLYRILNFAIVLSAPLAVAQTPAGFTTYTVPAGSHSTGLNGSHSGTVKRFLMAFDSTAKYTIPQTAPGNWIASGTCNGNGGGVGVAMALHEDQCDFNKTPSFQDCSLFNAIDSVGSMFAWRWRLDTAPRQLEIAAYSNHTGNAVGGVNRTIEVIAVLTESQVDSISPLEYKISIVGNTYVYLLTGKLADGTVINATKTLPRGCSGGMGGAFAIGFPYFGGTSTAPLNWTSYVEWGEGWNNPLPGNGITARYVDITTGNSQTTIVGTAFGAVLTATVLNSARNPMANVPVTFRLPTSSASGTFVGGLNTITVNSGANGLATTPVITANTIAGTWTPTAEITTDASPTVQVINYRLTNVANQAAQTLTFATQTPNSQAFVLNGTFNLAPGATSGTPNSGNAIAYSTSTPTVCSVNAASGQVTILAVGNCVITANQSGNANYSAAAP